MADILREFLVAIGFTVDDASKRRAESAIREVERASVESDRRTTQASTVGAGARIIAANREAGVRTQGFATIKAGMDRQRQAEEKSAADAVKRAEEEKARAKQLEKEAKDRDRARAQSVRELAGTLGTIFAAASASAAAATVAIVRIADGFDRLFYSSQRTGASVQNIKGIGFAFSQVGGSAKQAEAALDAFQHAQRMNPGLRKFVADLGVDVKADPTEQMLQAVEALNKRPYHVGARQAEMLGINEESYNLLSRQMTQIRAFRSEYDKTTAAIGLDNDKAARTWTEFNHALGSLRGTATAVVEKIATDLAPTLLGFLQKVETWVRTHPDEIRTGIVAVGTALTALVTGMADLTRQLAPVAQGFVSLSEAITGKQGAAAAFEVLGKVLETAIILKLLRIIGLFGQLSRFRLLGVLGLGAVAMGHDFKTAEEAQADPENQRMNAEVGEKGQRFRTSIRRGFNRVRRALGLGGDADATDQSGGRVQGGAGNAEGARESYTFWRGKGLTHEQAAGLVAMEEGESQFNPRARGDGGAAHGAFQWHPDRRKAILEGTGIDVDKATHLQQLEAAHWEMTQGTYDSKARRAWDVIRRAQTPGAAAAAGVQWFERPADIPGESAKRGARANYWAPRFKGSPVVQPAPISSAPPIAVPKLPPVNMSPGGFDVNKLTAPPMTTSQNDNSRSVTVNQNHTTKVEIQGATNPAATGQQVERAIGRTQETGLRNAQSAIR